MTRRACDYAHVRQCNDALTHWRSDVEIHQREHQATQRLPLRPMEQRDLDFIAERPVRLSMIGGTRSGGDNHARGCVNASMRIYVDTFVNRRIIISISRRDNSSSGGRKDDPSQRCVELLLNQRVGISPHLQVFLLTSGRSQRC